MERTIATTVLLLIVLLQCLCVSSWGGGENKDRVLLEKLTAITLTEGKMTNGRRTSPVRQLDCMGGSAGCSYGPKVVQCKNVGFDGYDVQWECTADLDNAVRFGQIEVTCEGYDYPDDPYVLRGSCGLRYQLDWTRDGHRERRDYDYHDNYHGSTYSGSSSGGSWFGTIIQLLVIGSIIYCVVGACQGAGRRHATESSYSSGSGSTYHSGGTSSGPGFWSGAATGGMLGYMFGNSGRRHYGGGYSRGWGGSGYGSGWGNTSGGWGSSSSHRSSGGSSSSSRSSSGFGGTSRR